MKEEYQKQIASLDETLTLLRGFWLACEKPDDAEKFMEKINATLDERLRLMKLRDEIFTLES